LVAAAPHRHANAASKKSARLAVTPSHQGRLCFRHPQVRSSRGRGFPLLGRANSVHVAGSGLAAVAERTIRGFSDFQQSEDASEKKKSALAWPGSVCPAPPS